MTATTAPEIQDRLNAALEFSIEAAGLIMSHH